MLLASAETKQHKDTEVCVCGAQSSQTIQVYQYKNIASDIIAMCMLLLIAYFIGQKMLKPQNEC